MSRQNRNSGKHQTGSSSLQNHTAPNPSSGVLHPNGSFIRGSDTDTSPWMVGERIDNRYEVLESLGRGSMGVVYKVRHLEYHLDMAVKRPTRMDAHNMPRLVQEARTWIRLGLHHHIVPCFYVLEIQGLPCIFLDFMQNGSLADVIRRGETEKWSWTDIILRCLEVFSGLSYAHENGVIHQDIKPANLLFAADNRLCIGDFGLVRAWGKRPSLMHRIRRPPRGVGTLGYSAPEQWKDPEKITPLADVYALGVVLFELCSGHNPFLLQGNVRTPEELIERQTEWATPDPREYRPQVPAVLADISRRCLAKDPAQRPSALDAELKGALRTLSELTDLPVEPTAVQLKASHLNNKAFSYWELGDKERAISTWDEALDNDATHPQAVYNRALVAWRLGEITDSEVLRRLKGIEETGGHSADALLYSAQIHLERAAWDDTQAALKALGGDRSSGSKNFLNAPIIRSTPFMELKASCDSENTRNLRGLQVMTGHEGAVTSVLMTPDGRAATSTGLDGTIRTWDLMTGEQKYITQHDGMVHRILRSADRHLYFWCRTPRPERLPGELNYFDRQLFYQEGQERLLSARANAGIEEKPAVWSCAGVFSREGQINFLIGYNAELRHHFAMIYYQDEPNEENIYQQPVRRPGVTGRATLFRPDFEKRVSEVVRQPHLRLITPQHDGTLETFELPVKSRDLSAIMPQAIVALSDRLALVGYGNGTLRVWDVKSQRRIWIRQVHEAGINALAAQRQPGSDKAAERLQNWLYLCGCTDGTLLIGALEKDAPKWKKKGHDAKITAVDILADGSLAVSGDSLGNVRLWRGRDGRCLRTFSGHRDSISGVQVSPLGYHLLSASHDGTVRTWNIQDDKEPYKAPLALSQPLNVIAQLKSQASFRKFLNNARHAIEAEKWDEATRYIDRAAALPGYDQDRQVKVLRLSLLGRGMHPWSETPELLQQEHGDQGLWTAKARLFIAPDGRLAVSEDRPGEMLLWDLGKRQRIKKLLVPSRIRDCTLSPEGRFAIFSRSTLTPSQQEYELVDPQSPPLVWDLAREMQHDTALTPQDAIADWTSARRPNTLLPAKVWSAVVSDKRTMTDYVWLNRTEAMSAAVRLHGQDIIIELSDTRGSKQVFKGHQARVNDVAVSPDGRFFATVANDFELRLWEAASARCIGVYRGHESAVRKVALFAKAAAAVTISEDDHLFIWNLDTGRYTSHDHSKYYKTALYWDDRYLLCEQYNSLHQIQLSRNLGPDWCMFQPKEQREFGAAEASEIDIVVSRLVTVISNSLFVDREEIVPYASFQDDLDANEMDFVEMLMAVEEEFDIEILDDKSEHIICVQDLIDLVLVLRARR